MRTVFVVAFAKIAVGLDYLLRPRNVKWRFARAAVSPLIP